MPSEATQHPTPSPNVPDDAWQCSECGAWLAAKKKTCDATDKCKGKKDGATRARALR